MFRFGLSSSRRRRRPGIVVGCAPTMVSLCYPKKPNSRSAHPSRNVKPLRWDELERILQSKFEPPARWRPIRWMSTSEDVSEKWEETIDRLLDVNVYPVGFSNMPQSVALVTSWSQQVSRALQHSTTLQPNESIEPALKLLDRLFYEEKSNHEAGKEDDGILMSPDIKSSAIANALSSWKAALLNPDNKVRDSLVAQERVRRYGMFLANHEGSLLSQISKVIGPSRLTNISVESDPVVDTPSSSRNLSDSDGIPKGDDYIGEFLDKATVALSNQESTSDIMGKESSLDEGGDESDDALLSSTMYNMDRRIQLAVEHWENACDRLLDLTEYPLGFSNTDNAIKVSTWFSELEQLLLQTNPASIEQAFGILQRWKDEEFQSVRLFPIAAFSLNWVLECWLNRINEQDPVKDAFTPEEVWEKVMSLTTNSSSQKALSLIIRAVGQVESPAKAPFRAETLLKKYIDEWVELDFAISNAGHLNNATINSMLDLWYRSELPEAPSEADHLLIMLEEWFIKYQQPDQIPDENTYASIIAIWTAGAAPGAAVHRAEVLLNEIQGEPSFVVLGTFIDALAKAGHVDRAHTMLNKYIDAKTKSLERTSRSVEPVRAFDGCNPVLSIFEGYRKRLDRQPLVAMVQMERFVSQLEKLATEHMSMRNVFHPNVACYNVLVGAYSHLRTPHKAEGLLGHVMRLLSESTDKVIAANHPTNQPVSSLFNSVLHALAESGEAEAVPRARSLVTTMETKCREDSFYQPTAQTYSTLLHCIANDRRYTAVENAREATDLLNRMERDTTGYMPKPNPDSYDIVLRAWCKAGYPDQAETLLRRFCADVGGFDDASPEKTIVTTFPTAIQFIIVMQGWASVARRRNGHHRSLLRVEQLLQTMHALHLKGFPTKPSITAHNIFLECLSKSEEAYAPERAESFLHLMEKNRNEDPALVPDVVIFNSVLSTWLRSNRYDAPTKASALFEKMKLLHSGSVRVINATTYTTLMGIYAQNSLASKVQETFDELMQSSDVLSRVPLLAYTTLLQAWSLAGKPDKTYQILEKLRTEYDSGRLSGPIKDSVLSFNTVLKCFLDSKQPNSAKSAIECLELMDLLASSGRFDVRPDHDSYSYVIKCFLFSDEPDAGYRARQIFERMKALYTDSGDTTIRPDLDIYTDLVSVLTRSKQLSNDITESNDSSHANPPLVEQLHGILEEIDSLVNPACWIQQGDICLSRIAWHFTETDLLSISEKVSLMFKLRRLADQHSVKLDHTIMLVLKNFREIESTASASNG